MSVRVLIRKKPDRNHLLLYFIDPFTRREVSRSAGTADQGEAERAAAIWEQELADYRGEANDGWKLFRDRYRDEHLATLSTSSRYSFGTALNHYQRLMHPKTVSEADAAAVSVFQSKLLAEGRKLTSIANYLRHLKSALNWAEQVGIIPKAPRVKLPKIPRRVFMRSRPITEAEYRVMLAACDDPELKRLMELLWLSGLRLGEALRLSWDKPPIRVDLEGNPYPQILYYAEGHKAGRDDVVPMTRELAAWLSKTPKAKRRGLVTPVGLATKDRVSEAIGDIGRACKIVVNDEEKHASAHDFRRAFGTRWAQVVMPAVLKVLMRHADIATTLRYYVGITSTDAGAALWNEAVPTNVPKPRPKRSRAG